MKANIPEVEALVNTDRSLVCDGKKGLLTRLLTVMKREPPDSSFRLASKKTKHKVADINISVLVRGKRPQIRDPWCLLFCKDCSRSSSASLLNLLSICVCRFWQARAVESFLRGATSYADQMFLLKRGLLEVKLQPWMFFLVTHENRPQCSDLCLISTWRKACSLSDSIHPQHILFCIIDSGCTSRDVLQSYFDLLGELMKFNIDAFKRFNKYVNTPEKV